MRLVKQSGCRRGSTGAIFTVNERRQDSVENMVELLAGVFRQESQYKISMLLEQGVLPAVASVRLGIGEMLRAIQFNDRVCIHAQKVHLHFPVAVERDRQLDVQAKTISRFRECLQATKKKSLAGAPGSIFSRRIFRG